MNRKFLKIYMWPVWFFQLFGQGKAFSDNPIIGSRALNFMGLHVLRIVLSHASTNLRWFLLRPLMPKEHRKKFHKDGFVIIENFLENDAFQSLYKDTNNCTGEARETVQGDTLTQRILLDDENLNGTHDLKDFVKSNHFSNYLSYAAAKWHPSLIYLQSIKHGFAQNQQKSVSQDPQKALHSDTFHPNMKAWYFLDDITEEQGPFTFVPGSHQLTWQRLKWEYKMSRNIHENPSHLSKRGSFRVYPDDLKNMNMPASRGLPVKANTLIIANPHGFHCRGQANPGTTRFEIWAYSRHNPFNPWPGLNFEWVGRLEKKVLTSYWKHMDKKAEKTKKRPVWKLIDHKNITDPKKRKQSNRLS